MHKDGYFHICSDRNGNRDACFDTQKFGYNSDTVFQLPDQYDFKITQINNEFKIFLNGEMLFEEKNEAPVTPKDVKIFFSAKWSIPLDCIITKFQFRTMK